ncbi:MAG TPA: LuxR C-terminal-related transcriptional regulator [Fimbriimonadaceae bacterium]|nr:LuxR C-terminal-related transcriptional regulator [Fimbriimonadaceae bacterium]
MFDPLDAAELSPQEKQVLHLAAADGFTDKQIAQRLGLSPRTVSTYWDRMRVKLGAKSRIQVLYLAITKGLQAFLQRKLKR